MGKKVQPKGRNPRKLARAAGSTTHPVSKPDAGDGEECNHYTKGSDELNRILLRFRSDYDDVASCEHCREEPVSKRGNKEKGKQAKKKGGKSAPSDMWVCLDCGHYFCGGAVKDTEPYGHARRHAKQELHPWAVRVRFPFGVPLICWCFSCNSLVPLEMLEGVMGKAESALDVEVGSSSGNAGQGDGIENGGSPSESLGGRTIKGLVNLGNTCFFNSVMQNLFAMDTLRECLVSMERPLGPLTMALKKLFVETSGSADSKGSLSPKALFGCICAKAPQFRGYQQQDSHELLRFLLDGLHTEETSARRVSSKQDKAILDSEVTFVDAIFGGQLSSTVSCMECGHTSVVHEPFLDLSLPVPSKKIPPKKTPSPLPKKSKSLSRERGRGRKFREKEVAKGTTANEHHKVGTISSPADCTEHRVPGSEPEQIGTAKVEEEFSWMDYIDDTDSVYQTCEIQNDALKLEDDSSWTEYIGPSMMPDGVDSLYQDNEISVTQCSVTAEIFQSEINAQCASNTQAGACSREPVVSSNSLGESSCKYEVPSSCTQDLGVILLPYQEPNPTNEERSGTLPCSQNTENLPSIDAPVMESTVQTTSIAGCEPEEADFDGFCDLFNEPEVTSEYKAEAATGQEMDTNIWGSNSSESNQDEVDNTNAPVSINSCLGLFTKPELLSDEHAWHCERCSEILSCQNVGHREGKLRTATLNQSEALISQVEGGEIGKVLQDLEVEHRGSTESEVGGNGRTASNSIETDSHTVEDPSAEVNISQKSLDLVGGSGSTRQQDEEAGNEGKKLLDPVYGDQAQHTDVILKDEGYQRSSCHLVHERIMSQDNQGSDSCDINDLDKVRGGGKAFADSSNSVPDHTETSLLSSCQKDDFSEVNKMEKKGLQSLAKVHPSDDSRGTEVKPKIRMVKRDATKRILINKAPLILTVHLKRFGQDARGRLSKLSGHISFQERLDLRPYMNPRCEDQEKCRYRLVGVVEHSGNLTGGHYVAYVRADKSRGRRGQESCGSPSSSWVYASDTHVSETSLSEVLQSEAYILFYERV